MAVLSMDPTTDQGDTQMRITVFGKGNVGGGLADLWERAGHQVTRFGRDGGDVSDADVVLVAVPGGLIAEAFGSLTGVEGKTMIDATNRIGVDAPDRIRFQCGVREVQDRQGRPRSRSTSTLHRCLHRLGEARVRPSNLWCGDEEAREVVEQLNRDAGYDPVHTGPLESAARQEGIIDVIFAISEGMGQYVYRFAPIEQL